MIKEKYTRFNSYFLLTLASSPTSKSTNDLTNKMIQKLFHKQRKPKSLNKDLHSMVQNACIPILVHVLDSAFKDSL